MKKRLELKMTKKMYADLEVYRLKNNFEDKQDAIRKILNKELYKKTFLKWLKKLFK